MYNDMRDDRLSPQQVLAISEAQGLSAVYVSIKNNGYRSSFSFWGKVREVEGDNEKYPIISIANDYDIVGRLALNISASVQFPESSAYMHFLGVVSSAMLGRFFVEYHGTEQPTSLYVVTSQPPSTGKSAINSLAIAPIVAEVDRINEERKKERKKVLAKISAIKNEMKGEKAASDMAVLYEDLDKCNEDLERLCDIVFPVSDTTPEGLAKINNKQGNFAVISDEATSVNSLLGMTYADASRKTNSELVLKAWDMGHVSIARSNADNNMSFVASGCISVIAQDETIDAIMQAGSRGIGVSERFLLVREESFLGRRTFIDDDGDSTYEPVNQELKAQYFRLIHNIMTEQDVKLRVTVAGMRRLNRARQELEPDLADGGKYSHTMLRGAMGKFDKQVLRIASVLHAIRNWSDDKGQPKKSREIEVDTIEEAILMFHELSKTYLSSADASGFAGESAELKAVYDAITKRAKTIKGGYIGYRVLYNSIRNLQIFKGQAGTTKKMKEVILPRLQELNVICVVDDNIFLNPSLLG